MKFALVSFSLLSLLIVGTGCTDSESKTASAKKYRIEVTMDESAALKGKKASDEVAAEEEVDDEDSDSKVQGQCKGFFGDGEVADVIKVAGSKQVVEVNAADAIALCITGNQNIVSIAFIGEAVESEEEQAAAQLAEPNVEIETGTVSDSSPDSAAGDGDEAEGASEGEGTGTDGEVAEVPAFKGICIFMAGNQATANVKVENANLGKFGLIARGNQAEMNLTVGDKGEVSDFFIDGKGNEPVLNISGEGKYSCPSADDFGRGSVNCADPAASQDDAANP